MLNSELVDALPTILAMISIGGCDRAFPESHQASGKSIGLGDGGVAGEMGLF